MNKLFTVKIIFFLITLHSAAYAQTSSAPVKLKEVSYGYYTSQIVEKEAMDNAPTGNHSVVKNQVLIKQTDKIPAKIGSEFGTVYQLKGHAKDSVQLDIEWVYPHEIVDTAKHIKYKNVRYSLYVPGNATNGSTYTLEESFEVVTGDWQINIYNRGKLLYTKTFVLN